MRFIYCFAIISLLGSLTRAAEPEAGAAPVPKLDADGPTSFVTALAFSPDGQTLYAAGWDKIVRVWRRDGAGRFQLDAAATFRVPIGPGTAGKLNALAVSSDGRWLATGGNAAFRHGSTFDRPGLIVPALGAMDRSMREDQGTIYVFDTRNREVRQLRGHQGAVVALEFANDEPSLLASAADEWDETAREKRGGIRLWNVGETKSLAATNRLPELRARPALAIIKQTGSNPASRMPSVAAAWGDDRLWVWNPQTGEPGATNDGKYNNTLAQVDGVGIVSGSAAGLKVWRIDEKVSVRSQFEQTLSRTIPRALAAASFRGNGALDTLAMVTREPGSEQDRLYLMDPRSGRLLAQPINLWNGRGVQPAIAASRTGDVAVTGGRGSQIVIHRIGDLRQNRATAHQTLDSGGETVRVAAIARNGERYGLVLSGTAKERPGQLRSRLLEADRLFDATAEVFIREQRGWNIDTPRAGGWTARHERRTSDRRTLIVISEGGRVVSRVELEPRQELGDYAVLPPRGAQDRPLLAVAYFDYETGQPVLALFDAARGERFREYLGHTGRITSVAFSGDGRLLATAAEDRTACIWTLADLNQVLGSRGQLKGLKVDAVRGENQPARVVVAEADATLRGLSAGDMLEGFVTDGRVEPFESPRAFYEALSLKQPGESVTLRRVRGADSQDVKLVVGQGVDERKPLLTFFVHRGGRQRGPEWIGWSPLGPYEFSGPTVEKLLGWHFNTGNPEAPVSFAFVDQYRARFETRGLVRKLLETGRPVLPPDRVAEAPTMSLWLSQAEQPPIALEPGSSMVIQRAPAGLEASTGPLSANEIDSIGWRTGDNSGSFEFADGQWRADFDGVSWKRGAYAVEIELRTKPPRRELQHIVTLVYQPAPPEIKSKLPRRSETASEEFEFRAELAASVSGAPFRARLTHQHGAATPVVVDELTSAEPVIVQKVVKLRPGINVFKLQAENDDAMADRAENERASASFEVYYNPPKATPGPRIDLSDLIVPTADGGAETRQLQSEDMVVVTSPRVTLRGTMRGPAELAAAQYRTGDETASRQLDQFVANKSKEFAFEQVLRLRPGRNRFTFESKTDTSEMATRQFSLEYRPRLPSLEVRTPPPRVFDEQITVIADVTAPADQEPYQVQAVLNDRELPSEKVLADEQQVRVLATLRPGDNQLVLSLRNQWGAEPVVRTLAIEYVQAPKIVSFANERQTAPDAVLFKLTVDSPRRPTAAVVQLNGQAQRTQFEIAEAKAPGEWDVTIKPVLLEPGENRLRVAVNDELSQSESKELAVSVEKRAEPAPQIVVLSAHDHPVLPETPVPVRVVVRSQSPIQDLVIEGETADGGASVLHAATDLAEHTRKNAQGLYEYYLDTSVKSASDPQQWRVEAVNRAGRQAVEIPTTVIVPPASLFLESVTVKSQPGRQLPLSKGPRGQLVLKGEVPDDRIVLSGYVLSSQTAVSRQIPVQVWANGFLQKPVLPEGKADASLRRPFKAEVILSQRRGNLIEVGIVDPDLPGDAANRTSFLVDCAKPNTERKLHLVIIAVGAKQDEAAVVRKRAVEALKGRLKSAHEFTTPAFEHGLIHSVLVGNTVQRNKVLFEVGRLGRNLQPNDVAMIYYQGDVREANDTFYLTTSATRALARPEQTEISREELNRWTGVMSGAQLILLDVDRSAVAQRISTQRPSVTARWPADSRIAFFRFAWSAPEPTKTPDEPVLLTAWQQAGGRTLAQIDLGLASFISDAASRYPARLMYDGHVPESLGQLEFVRELDAR